MAESVESNDDMDDFISREYQNVLAEQTFNANKILFLPTGSGKTFIAIMVLKKMFHLLEPDFHNGGKRAVFLVNTVALVEQQACVLERHLVVDKVGQYSGEMNLDFWDKKVWDEEFSKYQVMVMTAEILHQLLLKKYISLDKLALVILDECHHAVEDHPMRMIMRLFEDCPKECQPRVIGLTATLLNSTPKTIPKVEDEIKKLETTLHATVATVNSWDLVKQFSTNPREKLCPFDNGKSYDVLMNFISSKIDPIVHLCKSFEFVTESSFKAGMPRIAGFTPIFSGKKNDVGNLMSQVTKQLGWLGPYGCSKAIQAVYVTLTIMQQKAMNKQSHLMFHSLICLLISLSRCLEPFMAPNLPENKKAFDYSSKKVKALLKILEDHRAEGEREGREPMQALVFVEEKMTAKILCSVLKNISEKSEMFAYIKTGFIVGGSYNPLSESWEGAFNKRKNDKVLARFRLKEINVLIATDILEEGIDIPNCNLVVRFDEAKSFRSYVQSKGRARHETSCFSLMVDHNRTSEYLNKINWFKVIERKLEMYLVGHTDERVSPSERDLVDLYETELEPYITSIGSKVTMTSAIQLVNGYCMFLAHDRFCRVTPTWHRKNVDGKCVVAITLPKLSPLQETVKGVPMENIKLAKRAAALEVSRRLHQIGELNDNLMPNERCLPEHDLKMLLPLWQNEETTDAKSGTKNKVRIFPLPKPQCFQDCAPSVHKPVYFYYLDTSVTAEETSRYEVIVSCLKQNRNFAIVSSKQMPEVCQFPVFSKYGSMNIRVVKNMECNYLTEEQLLELRNFHWKLFSSMVPMTKSFLVFSKDSYLIAPAKLNAGGTVVLDWAAMKACMMEPESKSSPLECVLTPIHRGVTAVHEAYFVTRVCREMTAKYPFPDRSYSSYEDYFLKRHKFCLKDPNSPLLEVEPFQVVSDNLKPRLKITDANSLSSVIHFPIEACEVKNTEGALFLKAVLLPSILHRLERFLLAEELREKILSGAKIGIQDPHEVVCCCQWKQRISDPIPTPAHSEVQLNRPSYLQSLPARAEINQPWGNRREPRDIERDFDDVSIQDIQRYAEFCAPLKNSSTTSPYRVGNKVDKKTWELPSLRPEEGYIRMLSEYGTGPHPCHILEALTAASADDFWNLERLETLGDSFLKFSVSFMLFDRFPDLSEGKLTQVKGQILGNRNLFYCAMNKQLPLYMKVQKVVPTEGWTPPSFSIPEQIISEDLIPMVRYLELSSAEQFSNEVKDDTLNRMKEKANSRLLSKSSPSSGMKPSNDFRYTNMKHAIPDKSVADCVESLIGAYLETSGPKVAMQFLEWMRVLPAGSRSLLQTLPDGKFVSGRYFSFCETSRRIQERIGYKFKNESLLSQALTHASSATATATYERLEFVGDAVLDFLITAYIYESCGKLTPGELTDLRSALVNNITFACLTVRQQLHKFLNAASPLLLDAIDRFVKFQEKRKHIIDEEVLILLEEDECSIAETIDVPKALGDIFEAVIGAVFLDCGRRLDVVWRIVYRLMKTEICNFSRHVPKQVVRRVYESLGEENLNFRVSDAPTTLNMEQVHVVLTAYIKGKKQTFNGFGTNKSHAKKSAAKLALRYLAQCD